MHQVTFTVLVLSGVLTAATAYTAPLNSGGLNLFENLRETYERVSLEARLNPAFADRSIHSLMAQDYVGNTVSGTMGMETTKFQHFYKGLEVIGSMSFHHRNSQGEATRHHLAQFDLDTTPVLTQDAAASLAIAVGGKQGLAAAPELKILPAEHADQAELIYWVKLKGTPTEGGQDVLIDAQSGKVIARLSQAHEIAPIEISSARKQGVRIDLDMGKDPKTAEPMLKGCNMVSLTNGAIRPLSAAGCVAFFQGTSPLYDNKTICQIVSGINGMPLVVNPSACPAVAKNDQLLDKTDPSAARAHENSTKVLRYFLDHLGRNSFDNKGAPSISVIHGGDSMANAFWRTDLKVMVYGDGDGVNMGDLTLAIDVAGHEMTHGITSDTAKLIMMGEAGALNEAHSDFFGKMIEDQGDWVVGRVLFAPGSKKYGIRDIGTPENLKTRVVTEKGESESRAYPAHMKDVLGSAPDTECNRDNDRCWVHYNSTVWGHATYLIHGAIGQEKAEKLIFTNLTQNLGPRETFQSAAKALLQTCDQLGYSKDDCGLVQQSLEVVGL
jgi:Zn-dependent metalloprotease